MRPFYQIIVGMLAITICTAICGCGNDRKENTQQEQPEVYAIPEPEYEPPLYYPPTTPSEPITTEQEKKPEPIESPAVTAQPAQPSVTISKYYEKGYDAGYDDGEDDAVMDNGWGGQFDDSCPYKGKARKDYQLGYEEGYEAGYFDNKDGDE